MNPSFQVSSPQERFFFRLAAVFGLVAVVLGAMGAHGALHNTIVSLDTLDLWKTAVFYQLLHAVVILALCSQKPLPSLALTFFASGIVLFSGSLYLLALTQIKPLAWITPFGGALLIIGWATLIFGKR